MRPRTYFMMIFAIIVFSIVGVSLWTVREYLPTFGVFILLVFFISLVFAGVFGLVLLLRLALKMEKFDVGMHGSFLVRYNKIIPIAPMRDSEMVQMLPGKLIQPLSEEMGDYEDEEPEDVTISEEVEYEPKRIQGHIGNGIPYQSSPLLDAAARMYRAGNTGRGTLAKSLGVTENEARKLLTELRKQGRIE